MEDLILKAKIKEGNIDWNSPDVVLWVINNFKENDEIEVIIRKARDKRSNPQNRYYWKICSIIGNDLGYSPEDIHEILKHKFLKREKEILVKDKKVKIEKTISTTKLNTKQFNEFVEKIKIFSAEDLGIILPDPDMINMEDYIC